MNQKYTAQIGNPEFVNQTIFREIRNNFHTQTFEKPHSLSSDFCGGALANRILKGLPADVWRALEPSAETVSLSRGQNIHRSGDSVQFLYFPESAIISEYQMLENGKTTEVAMIGREGMLGVSMLFNARESINWTQVLVAGKALRINTNIFRRQFQDCGIDCESVFNYLSFYIAQISQRVICSNHHSVEERLCRWLLMIHDRCQTNILRLTQEQIAGFIGAQRPRITIITQSLREKGIISYVRGKVNILDRQKLERASCACYE